MKFLLALAPIAIFATPSSGRVNSNSLNQAGHVSFDPQGIHDILDVIIDSPHANSTEAKMSIDKFFKQNPTVLNSVADVVNEPKNSQTMNKIVTKFVVPYVKGHDNLDLHAVGMKAIEFAHDNPDVLKFVQQIINNVLKNSPSIINDFFDVINAMVANDPSIHEEVVDYIIKFSHKHEIVYKKLFKMILEGALTNVDASANLFTRVLEASQIAFKAVKSGHCS